MGAAAASKAASDGIRVGWFAPSYKQTQEGWELMRHIGHGAGATVRESDKYITYGDRGRVEVRTTDQPDRLRGGGWGFVVLDECREMPHRAWSEIIRPALMQSKGSALFISSPRPGWFNKLHENAKDNPHWEAFRFPTWDNPFIPASEIEALRPGSGSPDELPERVFAQEIEARLLSGEGEVFRFVARASVAQPSAIGAGQHVAFWDLADVHDFNFGAVFRVDGKHRLKPVQVLADRFNNVPWPTVLERIVGPLQGSRGVLHMDTTKETYQSSNKLVEDVRKRLPGWRVSGFQFSNPNKAAMVENLQRLLESELIELLDADSSDAARVQQNELLEFQATQLPSGMTRYAAPEGSHDDGAIAVMAAAQMATDNSGDARKTLGRVLGGRA